LKDGNAQGSAHVSKNSYLTRDTTFVLFFNFFEKEKKCLPTFSLLRLIYRTVFWSATELIFFIQYLAIIIFLNLSCENL